MNAYLGSGLVHITSILHQLRSSTSLTPLFQKQSFELLLFLLAEPACLCPLGYASAFSKSFALDELAQHNPFVRLRVYCDLPYQRFSWKNCTQQIEI